MGGPWGLLAVSSSFLVVVVAAAVIAIDDVTYCVGISNLIITNQTE